MQGPGGLAVRLAAVALVATAIAGCGRKGPPLAPLVRVPDAVGGVSARRLGDDVLVTVRLPTQNVDGSLPVSLTRVELHGLTAATTPTPTRLLEEGALVARWEPPGGAGGDAERTATLPTEITLRDPLEAADLDAVAPGVDGTEPASAPPADDGAEAGPATPAPAEPPSRHYLVVPFGDRGRAGPPGRVVSVPLVELPVPPASLTATYDESAVTLTWTPVDAPPDDPVRYDVYRRADAPAPGEVPVARPAARNQTPVPGPTFSEPVTLDGERRCYEVRSVRGEDASAVVGRPSPEACVTAVDTFPPAAPTGLNAIELQGAIDLTWVANREPDLAGYLVLRGEPGDATLTSLTAGPITETRYLDRDVRPGVRYTYAVKAVDTQPQPNESAESARLERTAR
jgi:hypothetical protein